MSGWPSLFIQTAVRIEPGNVTAVLKDIEQLWNRFRPEHPFQFAFRISIGPAPFLIAGGLAFGIAFLTVSAQAVKAALADPVKSLHHE